MTENDKLNLYVIPAKSFREDGLFQTNQTRSLLGPDLYRSDLHSFLVAVHFRFAQAAGRWKIA
jgi:hypothetical protein